MRTTSSTPSIQPGSSRSIDGFAGRPRRWSSAICIVDEFIYGEIARVSREAPVLILNYDSTEIVPGGAGNAAGNVAALGGTAVAVGVTGHDDTGRRLLDAMRRRVDVARDRARARHPHADQDAHPRRRDSFRQTAGRPHRSRGGRRR